MRVLSLFSGIGGIDLGFERAGHTVVAQSEVDPLCCAVLARHWPDVPNLGDVSTIDWTDHHDLDAGIIVGGYPCQPFSLAGSRQGDRDPRHLWPFMLDAVRVLRPRYAVMENVAGHLSLGFGRVLGDLAEVGYDAEWDCIPAAAVGAPHRRDRVWIVAYPSGDTARAHGTPRSVADAEGVTVGTGLRTGRAPGLGWRRPRDSGSTGDAWTVEPDVGRVAHGVPRRIDRLKSLGNAVVAQVAEHIARMIPPQ